MAGDKADRFQADDCGVTALPDQYLDLRGRNGQLVHVFGDVIAVLTPSEEKHYGVTSGVRGRVSAIKPSGTAAQPYIEVELLDGSGRTPTFYPSMLELAPEKTGWEAPHLPSTGAASVNQADAEARSIWDQRLAYLGDTRKGDADFAAKLGALYPGRKPKDQEKAFVDEFDRRLSELPLVPKFPRVGGQLLHGDDRMGEILKELRPGETPLLGGRGSLVIEKTSVGTSGKARDVTLQAGAFLITDERFTLNTRFLLSRNRREIQLADIQSIDVSTVMGLSNRITVRTPAGPVMMDILRNKREAILIRETLQKAADAARLRRHRNLQAVPTVVQFQQPPVTSGTSLPSDASKLKELFELHQMGAISVAEYEFMKAQIINPVTRD